ncbi:MAG: c-type cytochrome [Bacteroidetes bacterium]|nr:c-type cytochrome [Bacteroidota bacterium]
MRYFKINNVALEKNIAIKTKKYMLLMATIFIFLGLSAQTTSAPVDSSIGIFSNALSLTILAVIGFLLILISVLGSVLKKIAFYKQQKENKSNTTILSIALLAFLSTLSTSVRADNLVENITKSVTIGVGGIDVLTFWVLLFVILIELIIVAVLINLINLQLASKQDDSVTVKSIPQEPSFFEKVNASVAIENEKDILFDHEYDGIRELDNNLPPWWKYGFYLTIIFGVIYIINYHISKTGKLQTDEYITEVAEANAAIEEYRKVAANQVDENTVTLLTDASDIGNGKELFMANCAACHGRLGEGGVGPNLTDNYWIHGGGVKDIFKTIKYGVVEKGMKSWEADFSPIQISRITSYIKSINGTNPPNGKEKQGDLYTENIVSPKDSTTTPIDTITSSTVVDTLSKK